MVTKFRRKAVSLSVGEILRGGCTVWVRSGSSCHSRRNSRAKAPCRTPLDKKRKELGLNNPGCSRKSIQDTNTMWKFTWFCQDHSDGFFRLSSALLFNRSGSQPIEHHLSWKTIEVVKEIRSHFHVKRLLLFYNNNSPISYLALGSVRIRGDQSDCELYQGRSRNFGSCSWRDAGDISTAWSEKQVLRRCYFSTHGPRWACDRWKIPQVHWA